MLSIKRTLYEGILIVSPGGKQLELAPIELSSSKVAIAFLSGQDSEEFRILRREVIHPSSLSIDPVEWYELINERVGRRREQMLQMSRSRAMELNTTLRHAKQDWMRWRRLSRDDMAQIERALNRKDGGQ